MKTFRIKIFVCAVILLEATVVFAKNISSTFPLLPLNTPLSSLSEIQDGINLLYKDKPQLSREQIRRISEDAYNYQKEIRERIELARQQYPNGYPVNITTKLEFLGILARWQITMPSLIQRTPDHAANTIAATFYKPTITYPCDFAFPSSILLHHILDEVDKIETVGKALAARESVHNGSASLVLHFPFYGYRKAPDQSFLSSDFQALRLNLMQLTLDVYLALSWLHAQPDMDKQRISMAGFSLGSVLGWSILPHLSEIIPAGYASLVGGGDIAKIFVNRMKSKSNSEVEVALKDTDRDESALRLNVAAYDPLVWVHRVKSSRILAIVADNDEIMDKKWIVDPLLNQLKQDNNVKTKLNNGPHTPSGSAWSILKGILLPLSQFIIADAPSRPGEICGQYNSP